jgi:hypothetical protein
MNEKKADRSLDCETVISPAAKCPKVSNMISRELIWREVRSEKTLDLQGFYGVT